MPSWFAAADEPAARVDRRGPVADHLRRLPVIVAPRDARIAAAEAEYLRRNVNA